MFISIIFVSPLLSRTYENGTRDIIMTSELGKTEFSKNKILASYILSMTIFSFTTIPFLVYMYYKLSFDGLRTSFQYISLFSSFNGSLGDILIYTLIGSAIGNLSMVALTNTISVNTKNSYVTGVLSFLLIIISFSFNIFFRGTPYDKSLMNLVNLTPMNSSQYMFIFGANQFIKIFNKPIFLPIIALVGYIVQIIIFTLLAIICYRKKK